jgi:hypothetical protein
MSRWARRTRIDYFRGLEKLIANVRLPVISREVEQMDSSTLIPAAEALPAAPWVLRVLLDVSFAAHILLVNVMLGLTLLGFVRSLGGSRNGDAPLAPDMAALAGPIPNATALAVNLGIAPLLFLQALYGQFLYVSSTLMGVYWFAIVPAVMAAYGLSYRQKAASARRSGRGRLLWGLMSLLMLGVSLAQTSNAVLLTGPGLWSGYFGNPSGTLTPWGDPTLIPRWLHFVAASLALGGLALAMAGRARTRRAASKGDPEAMAHGERLEALGLGWFAWATLAQAVDGLWFLVSLPRPVRLAFLGDDVLATALMVSGLCLALATLALATLALAFRGRLMPAAASALATVAAMVAIRDESRNLCLTPYFEVDKLPVRPEYSTLALFLVCLALALTAVAWAVRTPAGSRKGA